MPMDRFGCGNPTNPSRTTGTTASSGARRHQHQQRRAQKRIGLLQTVGLLAIFLLLIDERKRSSVVVPFVVLALSNGMAPRQTTTTGTPSSPQQKQVYDVIVIGGGSAGLTAAKLSANTLQKRCVLVENNRLGADCTWTGCIPSKSLLAAAKNHYSATSTKNPRPKADFAKIQEQIQRNIQQIYEEDDSPETLTGLGVDVVLGQAVLISSNAVTVGQTTTEGGIASGTVLELHAKEGIILCTGAQPRIPTSIAGLDDTNYVTYETIWNLPSVPDRLTIVGGGPIGCEIGQAFQRLGAQVTIVTDQPVLLPKEDPVVGKLLEEVFVAEGMTICRGRVVRVEQQQQQHVCTCDNGQTVQGDVLLLAVGRVPRCSGMGLETVGVALTHNQEAIAVNSKLQTSVKGIYAAGDCTGDRQFTHYAGFQGAIAARNILLPLSDPGVLKHVPSTTFTSPEVAFIGLSAASAMTQYGADKVKVSERSLSRVDRAVCEGTQEGFIKIVYLRKNGKILGATIVAPSAGEMICEIAVMMKANMPFEQLATVMHPYPTYAFALQLMAAEAYYEKTLKMKWLLDILKKFGL